MSPVRQELPKAQPLGRRFPFLWLLGLCLCAAIVGSTPLATDMSAFLPRSPNPSQQILVDQLTNGVASRLILVGIEGGDAASRAEASRRLTAKLRERPDFTLVDNGDGGLGGADQAFVWRNRYLLSPGVRSERFTVEGLRTALQDDLSLLASSMGPLVKGSIAADPTGETLSLIRRLVGETRRKIESGVWVSGDGLRALIVAQTEAAGMDIDAQERAVAAIRQDFVTAPDLRLLLSGPAVFAVDSRARMIHDVTLSSTVATLAITALLLALYRSIRPLLLTLLPVLSGALAGLAATGLWFGFVHGVTLGFGVTLIGEAVDYAIYLLAQSSRASPPVTTLHRIWPTLRLGLLVSISGFAVMLFSSFTGFAQLGVFTIAGLTTALMVTRFVLPALLPADFPGIKEPRFGHRLLGATEGLARLRPALLLLIAAALGLIALRGGDLWQDELASMSPVPAAAQQLDRELRRDMGAPDVRYLAIAIAPDSETALEASERASGILDDLASGEAIKGYDAPSRYLPSQKAQKTRRAALPENERLIPDLALAMNGTPFRPDTFAPFLKDVKEAREQPLITRASLEKTALLLKLDSLLIERPGRSAAILPLRGVNDPEKVATALGDIEGIEFLDLKGESDRLLNRYRHEALLLSALGSAVIALLLFAQFRSLRRVLTVLAPLASAVVITVAILTLHGLQLSIFHLFGLLLVVAVGSNYCLFFERGGLKGTDGARTLVSLLLANICTVIGFGALAISQIPVLYGIGGTVALGTATSLLAAAILIRPQASEAA